MCKTYVVIDIILKRSFKCSALEFVGMYVIYSAALSVLLVVGEDVTKKCTSLITLRQSVTHGATLPKLTLTLWEQ